MKSFESKINNINFKNGVAYLTFKNLEKINFLKHAYSTRIGGVSKNEFKSMNLGFKTKDDINLINENYNIFCECLEIKKENLAITSQIHENKIQVVTKNDMNGLTVFKDTDGLITNEKNIVLTTFHADCVPLYIIDIKNKVVGLAHAGWKGTVKKIAVELVKKFINVYNSCETDLICSIGPSIKDCCFEVSINVFEKFKKLNIFNKSHFYYKSKDKININLMEVNKSLLIESGLKEENIVLSDICTSCYKDLLFSHRATNGIRGTNGAFISII